MPGDSNKSVPRHTWRVICNRFHQGWGDCIVEEMNQGRVYLLNQRLKVSDDLFGRDWDIRILFRFFWAERTLIPITPT